MDFSTLTLPDGKRRSITLVEDDLMGHSIELDAPLPGSDFLSSLKRMIVRGKVETVTLCFATKQDMMQVKAPIILTEVRVRSHPRWKSDRVHLKMRVTGPSFIEDLRAN